MGEALSLSQQSWSESLRETAPVLSDGRVLCVTSSWRRVQDQRRLLLCGSFAKTFGPMSVRHKGMQEDVRFRIMRLLEENPEMSQRELAQAAGVSVGGVNYVLNALIGKGFVKLGNFTAAKDKRRYAYVLTPKGLAEKAAITRRFLARKMVEYEVLKAEIEELQQEVEERIRP